MSPGFAFLAVSLFGKYDGNLAFGHFHFARFAGPGIGRRAGKANALVAGRKHQLQRLVPVMGRGHDGIAVSRPVPGCGLRIAFERLLGHLERILAQAIRAVAVDGEERGRITIGLVHEVLGRLAVAVYVDGLGCREGCYAERGDDIGIGVRRAVVVAIGTGENEQAGGGCEAGG